jgi:hypothetical protein
MNHVLAHARRTGLAAAALTLGLLLAGCGLLPGGDKKAEPKGPTDTTAAGSASGLVSADKLKPGLWKRLDKAPGTFESSGVAVFEDKVWIAGGLDEARRPTRNVWVFDPSDGPEGGWKAGPKLPGVLTHTTLARNGDRLLLAGGFRFDSGATAVDTVLQLDESGTRWEPGPPKLPIKLGAAAAAWDGKRVVLAGGVTSDESVSDAVFVLENGKWRELDDRLSQGREGLAADSDGKGKVWFMAGEEATGGKKTPYGNIDVVSGDTVTEAGQVPIARGAVAGFWLPPSTACVVGGRNDVGRPVGAVDCVDADGNQLSLPSLEVGRLGMVAAVLDNKLYVFGGLTRDRLASDLVDVLPLTG